MRPLLSTVPTRRAVANNYVNSTHRCVENSHAELRVRGMSKQNITIILR